MLELEVTVFNINNPTEEKSLNILNKCDTLKQYCSCIDIIRSVSKKGDIKSYDAAINECIRRGYLGEYLVQAAKGRRNMFFGEYSYEEDIKEQRRESFEAGEKQGAQKKADETAIALIKLQKLAFEDIATSIGISIERVKELAASLEK